jgi:hypothetical protein
MQQHDAERLAHTHVPLAPLDAAAGWVLHAKPFRVPFGQHLLHLRVNIVLSSL